MRSRNMCDLRPRTCRNGEVVTVCSLFQEMRSRRSQSVAEVGAGGPKHLAEKFMNCLG